MDNKNSIPIDMNSYTAIGLDLKSPEDFNVSSLIYVKDDIISILQDYKDKKIKVDTTKFYLPSSIYFELFDLRIKDFIKLKEETIDVYSHLFQLFEVFIIEGCMHYILKHVSQENLNQIAEQDSFSLGLSVVDEFLSTIHVKEQDVYRQIYYKEKIILTHCYEIISDVYDGLASGRIESSKEENDEDMFNFLDKHFDLKNKVKEFLENYKK